MCLILAAWRTVPGYPLVVAANRDEFHARPAAPAGFWTDEPGILAGRDLQAMGTWMGVSRSGRFAAVTNYRGAHEPSAPHSRGALVTDFLKSRKFPEKPELYSGFNLLTAERQELRWTSNRDGTARSLAPGIYGLGNQLLDSPEVETAKARFREAIAHGAAVEVLFGLLGQARILDPRYGTRCSTVLLAGDDARVRYAERSFNADGEAGETRHFELTASP
jgi:uncharacterized protein with NRDE domain